jgi:hypothetical protein
LNIDVSLLFWVEVGVYFLIRAIRSGSSVDVLAVGVAQGLAYLIQELPAAGGLPYIITAGPAPWPRRFASRSDPRALYEWQGSDVASGPAAERR